MLGTSEDLVRTADGADALPAQVQARSPQQTTAELEFAGRASNVFEEEESERASTIWV